jgi:polar amino acid transport system substrate-binding protein
MTAPLLRTSAWLALAIFCLAGFQARAGNLEHIRSSHELEVCAHPDLLPFSRQSDPPSGFQIELAQALADRLEVALQVSWIISKRSAAKTGCDLYAGVARIGDAPSPYLKLTDAFMRMESVLVTAPDTGIVRSVADLQGMTVGVSPGSVAAHRLYQSGIATASRFLDESKRLESLASHDIDAAIVSRLSAGWFAREKGIALQFTDAERLLDTPLNYDYAIGLRKADQQTLDQFNRLLADMKADGSLAQLFERHGLAADGQVALTHP